MDLSKHHIDTIKKSFAAMQSREDLIELLNFANHLLYGDKTRPIHRKSITYYSNPELSGNTYRTFSVAKKNGGSRTIHAPKKGLKSIQRSLNLVFQALFNPHPNATGFINEQSIVENALRHINSYYVFNIDVKDFFPSIDQARVWGRLKHPPFNLRGSEGRDDLRNRIAAICCAPMEVERFIDGEWKSIQANVLPQGAPTSPTLTNIIAYRLDRKLTKLAKEWGCLYTRYADDITFSSMHNIYNGRSNFRKAVERILQEEGFNVNPAKTRLQRNTQTQEVTGLIVNKKVNVRRRYLKELRKWLYLWERYGYEKASEIFTKDYIQDKGYVKGNEPDMANVLSGKLAFLKMVKGSDDSTFRKYEKRFRKLMNKQSTVNTILDVWEQEGIEAAMNHYYGNESATDFNYSNTTDEKLIVVKTF